MTPEKINKAIEDHFGLWWTDGSRQAILRDVGPEGLALIEEMSAVANDADLWMHAPSEKAYDDAQRCLKEKYPFLSCAAVARIATSAAYGWK
jgi:hypothetical protein